MADMQTAMRARLIDDSAISAAVAERILWSQNVPQEWPLPYVTLFVVSNPRRLHLRGYTGTQRPRVQVDVFAEKYGDAKAIADRIIAVMAVPGEQDGVRFGLCNAEGPRDLGEDTGKGYVHRASLDLFVEHRAE